MFLQKLRSKPQKSVFGLISTRTPILSFGKFKEQRNACGQLRMHATAAGKIMIGWIEMVPGRSGTKSQLVYGPIFPDLPTIVVLN